MAIYLRAADDAYSDRALVAGDSGRITRLSGLLDDCARVTEHRGLIVYTGWYQGVRVSLQSTGMGCPSMAMIGQELLGYGVKRIIRIGTCSAFSEGVRNGHFVVVSGSAAGDGTTRSMASGNPYVSVPDFRLTSKLLAAAVNGSVPVHIGPVVTVDVEPHLTGKSTEGWRRQGLLAVEMESATLFHLALQARFNGLGEIEAASVLTVSDGLEGHPDGPQQFMSDDELECATDAMHLVALEALVQ